MKLDGNQVLKSSSSALSLEVIIIIHACSVKRQNISDLYQ